MQFKNFTVYILNKSRVEYSKNSPSYILAPVLCLLLMVLYKYMKHYTLSDLQFLGNMVNVFTAWVIGASLIANTAQKHLNPSKWCVHIFYPEPLKLIRQWPLWVLFANPLSACDPQTLSEDLRVNTWELQWNLKLSYQWLVALDAFKFFTALTNLN